MVMNLLIRMDLIQDRRSIHYIFVSQLNNLIIWEKELKPTRQVLL